MSVDRFVEDPAYVAPVRRWLPRVVSQPASPVSIALAVFAAHRLANGGAPLEAMLWSPVLCAVALARARKTASLKPAFWSFWAAGNG